MSINERGKEGSELAGFGVSNLKRGDKGADASNVRAVCTASQLLDNPILNNGIGKKPAAV